MWEYLIFILLISLSISLCFAYERPDPLSPIRIDTVHDYTTNTDIEYSVDDTNATFNIMMPESLTFEERGEKEKTVKEETQLFSSFAEAANNAQYPVLASIEFCGQKGKFFDDGMYSAVELALDKGIATLTGGRQELLKDIAGELKKRLEGGNNRQKKAYRDALEFIATALILGGSYVEKLDIPKDIARDAKKDADNFIKNDPYLSKPIGFYIWTEELISIFRRDRYLATILDPQKADKFALALALSSVIGSTDNLRLKVSFVIDLFSHLTNPTRFSTPIDYITVFSDCDRVLSDDAIFNEAQRKAIEKNMSFSIVPPSRSKEVDLMNSLTDISGNTGLMGELIKAVKEGKIDLKPDKNSGWYQYQQYALECLLRFDETKEAGKLNIDDNYRKRLEAAFATMLTQARETHVKTLEKGFTMAAPPRERVLEVTVHPEFTIEPIATYYLRVARGYRFLESILNQYLDDEWGNLKPLYNGKESGESLKTHLKYITNLFYGFYLSSCVDIGIEPQLENDEITEDLRGVLNQAKRYLTFWQDPLSGDQLMSEDIRVIVPVGKTAGGILCWAVLGVQPIVVNVSYNNEPKVTTKTPGVNLEVDYETSTYTLLIPEFSEVIIPTDEPLTRNEFRKICDECKTRDKIKSALESYKGSSKKKDLFGAIGGGGIPLLPITIIGSIIIVGVIIFLIIRSRRKKKQN